ncbi:hypothetical protein EDC01DRAFT_331547 [Geopyxis carbonaria]|nr:hypothetical protein EDC01DRAFT_331547 [Geopyxis carbonaria]
MPQPRKQQSAKPAKSALPATEAPRRTSARRKLPPTKSPYFHHPSEEEQDSNEDEESAYGGDDADDDETGGSNHVSDEEDDDELQSEAGEEEEVEPQKKRRRAASGAVSGSTKKHKNSGDGVLIAYRAPSPGGTAYSDNTVHPNTLKFLKALAKHNDRAWLRENDPLYRAGKADFEKFVESVNEEMAQKVDDTIPELPVKDLVFRIHRDIRFSNDQTPYKTHFSVAWSRTGRKGPYASYFLSIEPGKSFAGGGIWHAEAKALALIRRDIDKNPKRLKAVLTGENFAGEFFGSVKKLDEKGAVKAFTAKNSEDALKTAPKTYPKDHKDIELLRLRSFTIGKQIPDNDVTSPDFKDKLTAIFKNMEPLITYLNSCVMPDINAEENDSDDTEE